MVSLITLYLEFGSSGLYKLEHLFLWQFAECLGLGHFLEVLCNVFMTQHPNISYLHACVKKVHWKRQSEIQIVELHHWGDKLLSMVSATNGGGGGNIF